MRTKVILTNTDAIPQALEVLRRGGLVAFPTDTVYGVACDPFSYDAIERLFEAKKRQGSKAIAVLVAGPDQLDRLVTALDPQAVRLAERFWPGALTLIAPRLPGLPDNLSPYRSLGVRMPDHPFALELLRQSGPLATTSANISGEVSPVTAQDVLGQLDGRIDLLLDGGACPGGVASTVVDCTVQPPKIIREGNINLAQILEVLG